MARREQHLGSAGQNRAAATLAGMGIEMVERIGTPVILFPVGHQKNVFRVTFGEKVSGDHRGILQGRSLKDFEEILANVRVQMIK